MRPPEFWAAGSGGVPATLLAPLAEATRIVTARRVGRPGWRASVPVVCCGNVTVGGAGKTTLALDLAARLQRRAIAVHFLSRGHGGRGRGVLCVDPARHDAMLVGDEALLLAALAPTWVAADRAAGARAAIAAGAELLLMDDGLQNPTLVKNLSLLVVDGLTGFGNGRMIPAGPLREPVASGAARCAAAVLIGADRTGAAARLPPGLPVLRARLVPDAGVSAMRGQRVFAIAGIAHPDKFFGMLQEWGVTLVETRRFPDHHRFTAAECREMLARAEASHLILVTTPKDAVRLPAAVRAQVRVIGVGLSWEDPGALDAVLAAALP